MYRIRVAAAALLASCAGAKPPVATPVPTVPGDSTVAVAAPAPPSAVVVRLAPQRARFLTHQRVEIQNDFQGLPPRQTLGFRSWFSVTLRDSNDATGRWPTEFVVDSIVADSGTLLPPTINLWTARGLAVRGWVAPSGELQDAVFSDSAVAQNLGRLLGWFRRFFPHLPPEGATPGGEWVDTITSTEPSSGATIARTSHVRAFAVGWERFAERDGLRIDVVETYEFTGGGDGGGQPLELRGSGVRSGSDYLSPDGLYLGGTSADTASLTITLPQQGLTIPQRQIASLTITKLP
jgi:hypothetical protein